MPPLYRCSRCAEDKPLADFPPSKATSNRAQWCRTCLRLAKRASLGLAAADRSVSCAHCGVTFETTYAKAMYCSQACKHKGRNRARQQAINAAKPDRSCAWCSASLPRTMRSDARFCSQRCNDAAHAVTRKAAQRAGLRNRQGDLISLAYIAERDGWRCGLCGGRVAPHRRHPDPLAASLDHVVPLSLGGSPDDPANLHLSHLRCNLSKRATAVGEQLRIVG